MSSETQPGRKPETLERQEKEEEDPRLAQFLEKNPEREIPKEDLRESGPEIAEFENMYASFEARHSLADLHSIIELTAELYALFLHDRYMSVEDRESAIKNLAPEDAEKYKIRAVARDDLDSIVLKFNTLKKETDIAPEKFEELKAKYTRLSRAVGLINNQKVDHDR